MHRAHFKLVTCLTATLAILLSGCVEGNKEQKIVAARFPDLHAEVDDEMTISIEPVSQNSWKLEEKASNAERLEIEASTEAVEAFNFVALRAEGVADGTTAVLWYPSSSQAEARVGPVPPSLNEVDRVAEFSFRLPPDLQHAAGEPIQVRLVVLGPRPDSFKVRELEAARANAKCHDGRPVAVQKSRVRRVAAILCAGRDLTWETPADLAEVEAPTHLDISLGLVDPSREGPGALLIRSESGDWERRLDLAEVRPDAWWSQKVELPERPGRLTFHLDSQAGSTIALAAKLRSRTEEPLPNLVLVSVDTLRADRMSLYGYHLPTTPRLADWFGRGGVVFENVVAPSPWTLPSHTTLFTGLSPLRHGVNYGQPLGPSAVTLAERLAAAGYLTLSFNGGGYLNPKFGLSQGFDEYLAWTGEHEQELEALSAAAIDRLSSVDEPYFLFFHTYRVHVPYRARQPHYSELFQRQPDDPDLQFYTQLDASSEGHQISKSLIIQRPGQEDEVVDPAEQKEAFVEAGRFYDSGIASVDVQIAELLEILEERSNGPLVALLTSDHGEALGENDRAGHAYLDDTNLHIPLLAYDSRRRGTELHRRAQQVSLEDVTATVLALAGDSFAQTEGRDLTPLFEPGGSIPPKSAVSYAASSNYGVSLTAGSRLRYVFVNTPWVESEDRDQWHYLESGRSLEVEPDAQEADSNLGRVKNALLDKLHSEHVGLHAQLNAGSSELRAVLRSKSINALQLKVASQDCPAMQRMGSGVSLTLPPNSSCEIILTQYFDEGLDYELSSDCGSASGRLEDFSTPTNVPSLCPDLDEAPRPLVAWLLDFEGARSSDSPELSDELEQQLRALGYVP